MLKKLLRIFNCVGIQSKFDVEMKQGSYERQNYVFPRLPTLYFVEEEIEEFYFPDVDFEIMTRKVGNNIALQFEGQLESVTSFNNVALSGRPHRVGKDIVIFSFRIGKQWYSVRWGDEIEFLGESERTRAWYVQNKDGIYLMTGEDIYNISDFSEPWEALTETLFQEHSMLQVNVNGVGMLLLDAPVYVMNVNKGLASFSTGETFLVDTDEETLDDYGILDKEVYKSFKGNCYVTIWNELVYLLEETNEKPYTNAQYLHLDRNAIRKYRFSLASLVQG